MEVCVQKSCLIRGTDDLDTDTKHQESPTACQIDQDEGGSHAAHQFGHGIQSADIDSNTGSLYTNQDKYRREIICNGIVTWHLRQDVGCNCEQDATQVWADQKTPSDNPEVAS